MADKQLVLSFFADGPAADTAAQALKDSGASSGEAMGILVLDASGNVEVDKVGARSWGAGAGVGACLLLLGPAALGVGIVGGTAAGGLHHKGLKLSDEDKARIAADLGAGKAAVGVLARIEDAPAIEAVLTDLGGATSGHDVVDEAALQAAAAEPPADVLRRRSCSARRTGSSRRSRAQLSATIIPAASGPGPTSGWKRWASFR